LIQKKVVVLGLEHQTKSSSILTELQTAISIS